MPKPTIMEMLNPAEIQIVNSEMGGYSFTIPADEYPAITFTRDMNGTLRIVSTLPTFLMFGNGHTRRFRVQVVRFTIMRLALKPARRKMLLLPLVAATYFMVSGGPYGIEDILGGAGYGLAILILLILPFVWSLPTALMVGELASAIPADGGFYVWVRRAMGPFWGFQEGWLSLAASIFDMAIYPAIFVLYLGKFNPALTGGWRGLRLVAGRGGRLLPMEPARRAGRRRRLGGMFALLLAPFAVFVILGFWRGFTLHPAVQWSQPGYSPVRASPPRSWWQCGITWAGTTPPPLRRKSKTRSATIHAP